MTKQQILDTLRLLSALEGWSFGGTLRMPDYMIEDLNKVVEALSKELLK